MGKWQAIAVAMRAFMGLTRYEWNWSVIFRQLFLLIRPLDREEGDKGGIIAASGEGAELDATLVQEGGDVAAALQTSRCRCDH